MVREINFDMDGTIADLYGVENWLPYLRLRSPYPYFAAKPLVNMAELEAELIRLQRKGYKINIISWLAKCNDDKYDELVTNAKLTWIRRNFPNFWFDKVIITRYGTRKETLAQGILFDDEENNRKWWGDGAYDVHNILGILREI